MPISKAALGLIGGVAVAGAVTIGVVASGSSGSKSSSTKPPTVTSSRTGTTKQGGSGGTTTTGAAPMSSTLFAPPLPDPSCQQEPSLKSISASTTFNLTFVNNTSEMLQALWLNYDGKRVFYRNIPAGTAYVQPTWITHPWIVADRAGTCLELYVVDGKRASVSVPVGSVAPTPSDPNAGASIPGNPFVVVNATDDQKFAPQSVDIRVNDLVEWVNQGTIGHNVTFDAPALAGANDLHLDAGTHWRVRFTKAGTYTYSCTIHVGMTGTIAVH